MTAKLQGKTAVVTGAGKGIGRATALLFAREGATVHAVARTSEALRSLTEEAGALPGDVVACPGDLTDRAFVERTFAELGGRLDVLVNNAGIAPHGSIFDEDPDRFRACLDLNVWAVFLCTQQAVRIMKDGGGGKIVNVGSVRSHWTESGSGGAYNASKYGLRGFTESVARELHGQELKIAVGLVCPGVVDTTLTNPNDEHRPTWLRPETVAEAILYAATAPAGVNVYDVTLFSTEQKPW